MDPLSLKGSVPNELLESLAKRGIAAFTPPQEDAIGQGLLEGKNMLVAAPTASGKTLIAEIAMIKWVLGSGRKAVYVAPMRALVSEKQKEFRENYPYIRSAISIGDLDSGDKWLEEYDILFVSTEKLDSLIRHGAGWLPSVGCIVFDEVHMLGDRTRGPTLELLMTKLMETTDAQLIALSATVGNAGEIAEWMKAELIQSDYRPIKLAKGVAYGGKVSLYDGKAEGSMTLEGKEKTAELRVVEDTLYRGKQALIFYSTKRNTEAGADRISKHTEAALSAQEAEELDAIGNKIMKAMERPTPQCLKLSGLVKKGVAFHHSGLLNQQRAYVEEAFKSNLIKVICSTTTLGLGVNMPAHTVLVKDLYRYNPGFGSERISVNEVMQLFGRAGRPKYDTEGRAIVAANAPGNIGDIAKRYLLSKAESVDSSLGITPVLRTHVLAFISEGFLTTGEGIEEFISKSFYGSQYGNTRHISTSIGSILEELAGWEFIIERENSGYHATRMGKRVSELYIDPLSARWMINTLGKQRDTLGYLYLISNTMEMKPHPKAREEAEEEYVRRRKENDLSIYYQDNYEEGYYDPVAPFATAMLLNEWMEERREDEIIARYAVTPGFIYSKLSNADWMAYSAIELAKIMKVPTQRLIDLRIRMRYGIREELLDLVRLEQIGRARARLLYSNGIKSVSDIRANREKVAGLLGKEIAGKVFEQLGGSE